MNIERDHIGRLLNQKLHGMNGVEVICIETKAGNCKINKKFIAGNRGQEANKAINMHRSKL